MEIVNGFVCKNCTDVDYAKKGIDPAHPKDGPWGAKAADRKAGRVGDPAPSASASAPSDPAFGPAIRLSGAAADVQPADPGRGPDAQPYRPGLVANISA